VGIPKGFLQQPWKWDKEDKGDKEEKAYDNSYPFCPLPFFSKKGTLLSSRVSFKLYKYFDRK
jgi:hypothetical protein